MKDAQGTVLKHKARLVAKGYVQWYGVDYVEVFVLVAQLESVRLILVLAVGSGWDIHHMFIKSAFLNDELEEEVFIQQPVLLQRGRSIWYSDSTKHAKGMKHQARHMPRQA